MSIYQLDKNDYGQEYAYRFLISKDDYKASIKLGTGRVSPGWYIPDSARKVFIA